jgi:hypothetical protein
VAAVFKTGGSLNAEVRRFREGRWSVAVYIAQATFAVPLGTGRDNGGRIGVCAIVVGPPQPGHTRVGRESLGAAGIGFEQTLPQRDEASAVRVEKT